MSKIGAVEKGAKSLFEKVRSKKDSKSGSFACDDIKKTKAFIAVSVILTVSGIITTALLSLSLKNKLIQTTTTTTTTTTSS